MPYVVRQSNADPPRYIFVGGQEDWSITKSRKYAAIFPTKKAAQAAIRSLNISDKRFWSLTNAEIKRLFLIDPVDDPKATPKEPPKESRTLWDRLLADDTV